MLHWEESADVLLLQAYSSCVCFYIVFLDLLLLFLQMSFISENCWFYHSSAITIFLVKAFYCFLRKSQIDTNSKSHHQNLWAWGMSVPIKLIVLCVQCSMSCISEWLNMYFPRCVLQIYNFCRFPYTEVCMSIPYRMAISKSIAYMSSTRMFTIYN